MTAIHAKKPGETLFGFLVLTFSLFLFWQSYEISGFTALSSPGAFPLAASGIMVFASCINLLKDIRRPAEVGGFEVFWSKVLPPIVSIMIAIIFTFGIILDTLGFIISALLFLIISIQFLHQKGLVRSVLLSLLSLIVIYIVFRLVFSVILPEGIIPEREIMAWIGSLLN
ncbi:tripartite tricarboxylate transporter TctB family protein [Amphritea sp.]|uniref:tripartite tricarboxylate transporter TctB family protein n=1 Tax=Amphritea sp. TaxID=1872502 RepID=UPI0025BFB3E1|nr:tripartite tricarboxylate transporter TctB family protein [Amphritea sp.]